MTRYLLNAPVLTAYGEWRFIGPLAEDEVRSWLNEPFVSAIGHAATATFLSRRFGVPVDLNRIAITMAPGDSALVLRLKERLPEGAVLDDGALAAISHEFGLLERLS